MWGVTFGIKAEGYQTGQKFLKPSENYLKNRLQRSIFQEKFLKAIPQKPLALSFVSLIESLFLSFLHL